MINDKIRFGARVIADQTRYPDANAIEKALVDPDREEYARALFLAAAANDDGHLFVVRWLEKLREKLGTGLPSDFQHAQVIIEVLQDEDIFEPVKRQDTFEHAFMDRFVTALKSEPEYTCMERVWQPSYDEERSNKLWASALGDSHTDDRQAVLLAERAQVDAVDLVELAGSVHSVSALRILAAKLSPPVLQDKLDAMLKAIEEEKNRWRDEHFDVVAAVLGAEAVRRTGRAPDGLGQFMDAMLERCKEFRDIGKRALVDFVTVAKACGCVDRPEFMQLVCSAGTKRMSVAELQEVLDAGMPVSIARPLSKENWNGSGLHLLTTASEEQVHMLASRMDDAQRRDFLAYSLPSLIHTDAAVWSKGVSCIENNLMVVLQKEGFELGGEFPGYKDAPAPLYERASNDQFSGGDRYYPKDFMFTALHALGVYPVQGTRLNGLEPMHLAAIEDDAEAIRALVALGHDLESKAEYGYQFRGDRHSKMEGDTPLVLAVRNGCERALAALIELGADVGAKAGTGATVMQLAKSEGLKRLIRAARTGASVTRGMSGGHESRQNLANQSRHGIL